MIHQSVGHIENHTEFREISPIWRIRGPILVPKTRRTQNPISRFFITLTITVKIAQIKDRHIFAPF